MIIAHLTSAHPRNDPRIFFKQCRSLANAGHSVYLVVADGLGDETRDGVHILDVGRSGGRIGRMLWSVQKVYRRAQALKPDVLHLHDPELLSVARFARRRGMQVIFDSHEDVPRQILSKEYLPYWLRPAISWSAEKIIRAICRRLDIVVAATPVIRDSFKIAGIEAVEICNYPISEGEALPTLPGTSGSIVCYIGGLSVNRGIREIVQAMKLVGFETSLEVAGSFVSDGLEAELTGAPDNPNVHYLGYLSREGVNALLSRSVAGLVTLHPTPAYLDSLPIKMFEYMSAGLPVIASNFPLWRQIIEGNDCGICVDPLDPSQIASAIDELVRDREKAQRMGRNGRRAVKQRYNWASEETRLIALYDNLNRRRN